MIKMSTNFCFPMKYASAGSSAHYGIKMKKTIVSHSPTCNMRSVHAQVSTHLCSKLSKQRPIFFLRKVEMSVNFVNKKAKKVKKVLIKAKLI